MSPAVSSTRENRPGARDQVREPELAHGKEQGVLRLRPRRREAPALAPDGDLPPETIVSSNGLLAFQQNILQNGRST